MTRNHMMNRYFRYNSAMASLMVLFLSLGCLAMPAISMNECLIGESFWCSTVENAVSCSAVEFCSSSVWKNNNLEKELSNGNECKKCLNGFNNMKVAIQDEDSKELIKSGATESICSAMGTDKKLCSAIISQTVEDVFNSLLSDSDGITRCQALDYCGPEKTSLPQVSVPVNSFWCKFCIKAFDEVKKAIGSNPSRQKVEEEFAKVCKHVPKLVRKECDKVVKKFADEVIDLLLKKASSEKICNAIHACSTQLCASGEVVQEVSNQCETCEVVVRLLEGLTEGNHSALRSVLLQSCPKLPCKYQASCLAFEKKHGESLLQNLNSFVPIEKICSVLKVCTDVEEQLSSFKCIAGPNFWCSSPANAKFCEAEDHCKRYVWA